MEQTPVNVDEFGHLKRVFEPMEDEYCLVGRVVRLAALVEVNIHDLLLGIEQTPQIVHVGAPVVALLLKVRATSSERSLRLLLRT